MTRFRAFVPSFVLAGTITAAGAQAEPPDWAAVSAIFTKRCVMCHSQHGAAHGLRLDSYEAAIAGGTKGAVLVPGNALASELIRRLRGDSTPRMPLLSRPLTPEEIEVIIRWIKAGLPENDARVVPPHRPDNVSHSR